MTSDSATPAAIIEFEHWFADSCSSSSSDKVSVFLIEHSRLRDGNLLLELSFSTGENFSIICPIGYPDVSKPLFQVRAGSTELNEWAQGLNQYASSMQGAIKLCGLLTEAVRRKKGCGIAMERQSSEDEGMEDEMEEEDRNSSTHDDDIAFNDEHFTTDWEIEIDILKKRWFTKQSAILKGNVKDKNPGILEHKRMKNNEALVRASDQIFTHNTASFQILSNEMVSLLRREQNDGVAVECIDDDLYQWSVKISGFSNNPDLEGQLARIRERYGYDYIELQLSFVQDFPFYPPLLRVIRPRFQGSLVQSLANIDLLKVTYWNPTRPMGDLLGQMKLIVERHARLEIDSKRNDILQFPTGAYHPLEDLLIQLALATEQRPRANYDILPLDGLAKAPQLKCSASSPTLTLTESSEELRGWAKGTGYGHGRSTNHWNPDDYVRAQKEKNRQVLNIVSGLSREIVDAEQEMGTEALERVIEGSALIPYLESEFSNATLMEVGRHVEMFRHLLGLVEALIRHNRLLALFRPLSNQRQSLKQHISKLSSISQQYLNALGSQQAKKGGEGNGRKKGKSKVPATASCSDHSNKLPDVDVDDAEHEIAMRVTELERLVDERLSSAGLFGFGESSHAVALPGESLYTRSLASLQFGTHEAILSGACSHYFAEKRRADLPADMIKAVFRDLSSLQTSLPLTDSSSVFFRYDDENVGLAQAMITGPENTPYANGCFLFDILFPDHYPQVPPQVNSRTNGGGSVRFNPNLYDNGKVCLSLLGTWSGERGESWNSATSTLLQVLVSIQSLILIDDPYFNEPGYESTKGTKEGDKKSADYNVNIRAYTIKWAMLEQLKHPPPAFTDVVKNHFRLKREAIRLQLADWQMGNGQMKDSIKQTLAELDKLT